MDRVAANLEKQYSDSNSGNGIRLRPLLEIYVSDIRRALWVIFAAVAFVLLIACANIANLCWLARQRVEKRWRSALHLEQVVGESHASC
jgi:hypothetical protein